jgi:hypothetical protein
VCKGDFVVVRVTAARGHTLRAEPIAASTLQASSALHLPLLF